jgi:signal transduction protein with GAF and PtsI domain
MILLQRALDRIADDFGAMTATLHAVDPGADPIRPDLVSIADRGIPESVRAHTRLIPFGKGMAGLCAERRAAVTVCNLQTDASGVARPGARETGVAGAIVVPIFDALSGRLVGTLGIGKPGEHTYLEEEIGTLAACAEKLAPIVVRAAALGGSR